MKYLDAHCHIPFDAYDEDREAVYARMREEGVGAIVVGVDRATSEQALSFAEGREGVWATIGLHPNYVGNELFDEVVFGKLVRHPKAVGVGECGLDYFRTEDSALHEIQTQEFAKQIRFAISHDKPLMIHARPRKGSVDAYRDLIDILREYKKEAGDTLRGNVHFFVGGVEEMQDLVKLGFSISIPGTITFTNDYDEVVRSVPREMLLSETDSPYATPVPHRGARNEPVYVRHVVARVASLWNMSEDETARLLRDNATRVFSLNGVAEGTL